MSTSFKLDPLALLRDAVNRLETAVNAYATGKMQSEQFSVLVARLMKLRLALKLLVGKALAGVYARLDIPSRTELAALAAAVQRIEDKVNALLPPPLPLAPRPARTRRAPEPAAADVPVLPAKVPAAPRRAPARKAAATPATPAKAASRNPRSRRAANGELRP